jgi:phenylacetic acid degradation operon negative regulatory protein
MQLYFTPLSPAEMTAKKLVLSLMSVTDHERQPAANLVASGEVFGIEPTAMRMAITRLVKEGILDAVDRGIYTTGPAGHALRTRIASWETAMAEIRPWLGDWLVVQCDHLGRTETTRVRSRERALRLGGFAASPSGLWVRPNNLAASLEDIRGSLLKVGLDHEALIFVISQAVLPVGQSWADLWSAEELTASYEAAVEAMAKSAKAIQTMNEAEAAKETLLVGQSVIRLISFDPLLPEELIDRAHFERLVAEMKSFNALGVQAWKRFYASLAKARRTSQ